MHSMIHEALQTTHCEPEPPASPSLGFDPYDSGCDLERLKRERRRTLDDMRRLDEEIKRERAQERFRKLLRELR